MSKSTESRTQKPGTQGGLTRRNVLRFAFGAGAAVALSNPLVAFAKPSASKETLNELSDKQEEYEAAMAQLNQISDEYQALSVEADQTKSKIEDILTQIDDTQTQIDDKEQELTTKQDELSERLAADYKGGDQGLLSVLLASTSFEELGSNLFYINGDNLITTTRVDGRPHNVNSGDIENWGLEANAAWRINPRWSVNANYSWVHMENPVISAPQHKLYAGADFHQGRWAVSTGVQYVKGLYTSVGADATTEDFVLWNVRASYRLCPYASLFVRGENLLAQRYEIMAGYPMPKATFLGGVNVSF